MIPLRAGSSQIQSPGKVKDMLQESLPVWVCTFCKAKTKKGVPASVMVAITTDVIDATNYDLAMRTYPAPTFKPSDKGQITFGACPAHESSIVVGQLAGFMGGIYDIADLIAVEETPIPKPEPKPEPVADDGQEESEEDELDKLLDGQENDPDIGMDEDDLAAAVAHVKGEGVPIKEALASALGPKVIPANLRVNNPKPAPKAPADKPEEVEGWRQHFDADYEPAGPTSPPKGDEKDALRIWFAKLPVRTRKQLAPNGITERRLKNDLINAWQRSEAFAEFLKLEEANG